MQGVAELEAAVEFSIVLFWSPRWKSLDVPVAILCSRRAILLSRQYYALRSEYKSEPRESLDGLKMASMVEARNLPEGAAATKPLSGPHVL